VGVLNEPAGVTAELVVEAVRAHWDLDAYSAEHLPVDAGAHHWAVCSDGVGQRWFATVDALDVWSARRRAYESTRELAGDGLGFVVAPVLSRSAQFVAVLDDQHLISLTPWIQAHSGPGAFADDAERVAVTGLLGRLHATARPRDVPVWRPELKHRVALESALLDLGRSWDTGPYAERHTANVLWTEHGPLLVDWESVALAPRERDLRTVLAGADGTGPASAYVAAGGCTQLLDADTVELFERVWQLEEIGEYVGCFRRPHTGSSDDNRRWRDLMDELPPNSRTDATELTDRRDRTHGPTRPGVRPGRGPASSRSS
jgi:spectinomycin phosphotransferase